MTEKTKTITLPLSLTDCYKLVKKLGNETGFKEKSSEEDGIVWVAKNFKLETWLNPISESKTEVEIIAISDALFDGGTLEQQIKIFAKRLKSRVGYVFPVETQTSSLPAPAELPELIEKESVPPLENKKCPYCAEIIKYEAIVCRYCGRDLAVSTEKPSIIKKELPIKTGKKELKSPKTAVLLNLIPLIFGLGYIYTGKPIRFVVVFGIQIFSMIPMEMLGLREYNVYLLGLVWIISIFDVYNQAKKYNEKISVK